MKEKIVSLNEVKCCVQQISIENCQLVMENVLCKFKGQELLKEFKCEDENVLLEEDDKIKLQDDVYFIEFGYILLDYLNFNLVVVKY